MRRHRKTASDFANKSDYPLITIGIVEDTNDVDQLGRMKVRCQAWLDGDTATEDLPYVRLSSAFFGFSENSERGVNGDVSNGPVAYGQWAMPQIGSQVLVTLIDNDPNHRVFLGSIHDIFLAHTLPHGRQLDNKIPLTSSESAIEPLATNTGEAFKGDRNSAEYATRAMDRQVAAYPPSDIGDRIVVSKEADQSLQIIESNDGSTINRTQGFVKGKSAIFSTTTPGFHSFSMDDDPNNCRVRFRTTSGHQVILDDTNERIYISTAKGKTWIEIDEKGTIDIYGEQDISISSDADVNIRAKDNVRISGGKGIHMTSGNDIRMHSKGDSSIKTDGNLRIHSKNLVTEVDENMNTRVNQTFDLSTNKVIISSDTTYDLEVIDTYKMSSDAYKFNGTEIESTGSIHTDANVNASGDMTAGGTVTSASVITGTISAGSVSASGGISAGGAISSSGSITTSGILSSSADVIAGSVSLRSHVHLVPLPKDQIGMIPSQLATPTAAALPVSPPSVVSAVPPVPATPISLTQTNSSTADELPAYFPSRIPQHEPFTRSYLKKEETDKDVTGETTLGLFDILDEDVDSVSEYPSTDPNAGTGSASRGKDFMRNSKWRR